MSLIKLAISRQTKQLVNYNGGTTSLPPLFQTNDQSFQITIVDDPVGFGSPYTPVDLSAAGLRVVISQRVTGQEGDEAENLLAATYEAGWAWDAINSCFTGSLNLHTSEIAGFLLNKSFAQAFFEINAVTGGVAETIYGHRSGQENCFLQANADIGGADAPSIISQPGTVVGSKTIQDGVGGVTVVDNVVTISGLALAGAPANVFIWILAPSGSPPIWGNFVIGSSTADHFSVILGAIPENNNYKVLYIITF